MILNETPYCWHLQKTRMTLFDFEMRLVPVYKKSQSLEILDTIWFYENVTLVVITQTIGQLRHDCPFLNGTGQAS